MLLNSPFELGMRTLLMLSSIRSPMSINKIAFLDYIIIYAGEFVEGADNLHAASPFKSGEWVARHTAFERGVNLMISRSLLIRSSGLNGFVYQLSDLSLPFLTYIEDDYKANYYRNISAVDKYVGASDEQLSNMLGEKILRWSLISEGGR